MGCYMCGVFLLGFSNTTKWSFRNVDSGSLGSHENHEIRPILKRQLFLEVRCLVLQQRRILMVLNFHQQLRIAFDSMILFGISTSEIILAGVPKFEIQDMWSPSVCWCIKALVLSMVPWQRHTPTLYAWDVHAWPKSHFSLLFVFFRVKSQKKRLKTSIACEM